jgi:hypothetical protein
MRRHGIAKNSYPHELITLRFHSIYSQGVSSSANLEGDESYTQIYGECFMNNHQIACIPV